MPESLEPASDGALHSTRRARSRRWWLPGLILITLVLAIITIHVNDSLAENWQARLGMQWLACSLALLMILVWFMLLGGYSRRARVQGVVVMILAYIAFRAVVRNVELSGDLVPTLEFRWEPLPDTILVEHRRRHQAKGPIELPQNIDDLLAQSSPGYRGLHRDGRTGTQDLSTNWTTQPPACRWRQPVGGGYAGFALLEQILVTLEQRESDEALVAYDAASGAELWCYRYPASFTSVLSGEGPRATPCISDGRVFSVGALGQLLCVELTTGKRVWHVDLFAENGMAALASGIAASPLVVGPNVVVYVGAQGGTETTRAMLAFNRSTGSRVWGGGRAGSAYVSPMLVEIADSQQILIYDCMGVAGFDPNSGEELWRFLLKDDLHIIAAQPVVLSKGRIFFASEADSHMIQVSRVDGLWKVEPLWNSITLRCAFCSPIAVEESLYGLDGGILTCIDITTGKRRWKRGRFGHGQMLLVNDYLLVQAEFGEIALVAVDPNQFRELGRFVALDDKTWNIPSLVAGRLFLRNHREMTCYDLRPVGATATLAAP